MIKFLRNFSLHIGFSLLIITSLGVVFATLPQETAGSELTAGKWNDIVDSVNNFSFDNGNIGIGDATPDAGLLLDVEGKIGATEYCDESGVNCVLAGDLASGGGAVSGKFVDGTTTTDAVFTGGNVGIGTSAPGSSLHITGTHPYITLEDTEDPNGSQGSVTSYQDGGMYYDANRNNTSTAGSHYFRADGATKYLLTLKNNGNVGIGTTTPQTALDIKNSNFQQLRLGNHGNQDIWMGSVWSSVGSYIGGNNYYSTSWFHIPTASSASGMYFRNNGGIQFYTDTGLVSGVSYTPSVRMTVGADGNIGIGTGGPTHKLTIVDNDPSPTTLGIFNSNSSGGRAMVRVGYSDTASFDIYRNANSADIFLDANQGNGAIRFQDAGVDTLAITNGGDIQISKLASTYSGGAAYACINNLGQIYASEVACP